MPWPKTNSEILNGINCITVILVIVVVFPLPIGYAWWSVLKVRRKVNGGTFISRATRTNEAIHCIIYHTD